MLSMVKSYYPPPGSVLLLVKPFRNLYIIGFFIEKYGLFSDFQYDYRSFNLTPDLLTTVADRIARAFNLCGATGTVACYISKDFSMV